MASPLNPNTPKCPMCAARAAKATVATAYAQYYRCQVCDAFWGVPKALPSDAIPQAVSAPSRPTRSVTYATDKGLRPLGLANA